MLSRIISCYVETTKRFLSPILCLKAQSEQRKIKFSSLSKWKAKIKNQAGFFMCVARYKSGNA